MNRSNCVVTSSTGTVINCTVGPLFNASALVTITVKGVAAKGALFLTSIPKPAVYGMTPLPLNGGMMTVYGLGFGMNIKSISINIGEISWNNNG